MPTKKSAPKTPRARGTGAEDGSSATTTEINERAPKHFFEGAQFRNESEGLRYNDIPRHISVVDEDDETELDADLTRTGAGDRGASQDDENLEALESEGLDETGV